VPTPEVSYIYVVIFYGFSFYSTTMISCRLTEFVTIDALPDSALLNIFTYLNAKDLCSVTEV